MPGFSPPRQTLGGKGRGPHRPTYGRRGGRGGWLCAVEKGGGRAMRVIERGMVGSQAHTKNFVLPITLPRHH